MNSSAFETGCLRSLVANSFQYSFLSLYFWPYFYFILFLYFFMTSVVPKLIFGAPRVYKIYTFFHQFHLKIYLFICLYSPYYFIHCVWFLLSRSLCGFWLLFHAVNEFWILNLIKIAPRLFFVLCVTICDVATVLFCYVSVINSSNYVGSYAWREHYLSSSSRGHSLLIIVYIKFGMSKIMDRSQNLLNRDREGGGLWRHEKGTNFCSFSVGLEPATPAYEAVTQSIPPSRCRELSCDLTRELLDTLIQ